MQRFKDKGLKDYLLLDVEIYCYLNKSLCEWQENILCGGQSNLLHFHV